MSTWVRTPTARYSAHTRRLVGQWAIGWLGVVVLAAAWQLAASAMNTVSFPTFLKSISAVGSVLSGSTLHHDLIPSIERVLIGFGISGVLGIVIGLTLGYVRWLGDYCVTVIDFLRSLPTPLFVPLAIVLLGLGSKMVVAIIVTAAVWPVLLNAFDGSRRIEPMFLDAARACGLRGVTLFWRVLLPATLPSLLAGLRLALSTSLAVLVVAEILGASSGIGYFIGYAQQTFLIPQTYAGVIILAVLGWLFDTVFLVVEHRVLRWERPLSGGNRA